MPDKDHKAEQYRAIQQKHMAREIEKLKLQPSASKKGLDRIDPDVH